MRKSLFVLFAAGICQLSAVAQQTGSFNANITFNSESRTLSNYVPTDYNAANPYRLVIGLHGMGDNSINYRDAMVNILNFGAGLPNTILICPDGGSDQGKDFYTPAGDEAIIQEAINYAKANYNIDPAEVILQGFSLGGRSALRYALDNPTGIKALLLNTPAIQGVKEARNKAALVRFDYAKAASFPIFVTLGNTDAIYVEPVNETVRSLVKNDGMVAYKQFAGGHTVPDFRNYEYLDFFDQPAYSGSDASVFEVTAPVRSCDGNIAATVLLQNTGEDTLKSVKLAFGIGNKKDTLLWQGSLPKHIHAQVQLPGYQVTGLNTNTYDYEVVIIDANAGLKDTITDFNAAVKPVHVMTSKLKLPFEERFTTEADFEKWASNNSGDYLMPLEYSETDGALFSFNTIFIFDNSSNREEVLSPTLDMTGETKAYLHFKTDYNYTSYTASVFGIDTVFADTLEVLVSTDCGATYTSVFRKHGADLTSQSTPLVNPLSIDQVALDVNEGRYKSHMVDMSQYAGQANVHVKFSYISGLGGYIYLDDVVVNNNPASEKLVELVATELRLYPNPATEQLNVSVAKESIQQVQIYNVTGQLMQNMEGDFGSNKTINVSNLAKGAYWMKVTTANGQLQDKFIVQ